MVNSGTSVSARCGIQHAVEDRGDQEGRESLRGSHQRHQDHRKQQRREVGPDVVEEAAEFGHWERRCGLGVASVLDRV